MFVDEALAQVKEDIMKAAETVSTNTFSPTTRSIFSPENLDEKIKVLAPTDTPLRNRLPRVKGMGQAAGWKVLTSKLHSGSSGSNTSIFFADAGAPNETSQTYTFTSAAYKLLGRKLEVGGLSLAASKGRDGQPDQQASRETIKMIEVMIGEEEGIISGSIATASTQFDGLGVQITTNSGNTTFLTASGINVFNRTLYGEDADPTLLVASARQLQALADDLEKSGSIQRVVIATGTPQAGAVGGLALSKVVNSVTQSLIDVKPSRYVGFNAYLLTEKSVAGENWIEMDDLLPMSRVDVPSSNFSQISFIVEATVLKVIGEPKQFEITVGA